MVDNVIICVIEQTMVGIQGVTITRECDSSSSLVSRFTDPYRQFQKLSQIPL